MKTLFASLACVVLVLGCSTPATLESRKSERVAAYAGLTSEERLAVDHGRLRHGMNTNAAYIAWGNPTRVISEGQTITWLFEESDLKEYKSTTVRGTKTGGFGGIDAFSEQTSVLYPYLVAKAKIVFTNGIVKEWWKTERPAY